MVDIEKYSQQLEQRREVLETARQKTGQQQKVFSQIALRTTTPLQRQAQQREFEEAKKKTLLGIKGEFAEQQRLETEFQTYRTAHKEYKQELYKYEREKERISEFEKGWNRAIADKSPAGLSKQAQKGFRAGSEEMKETQRLKQELKKPEVVVSESLLKDIEKRAETGELEAQKLLARIESYVPEESMKEMAEFYAQQKKQAELKAKIKAPFKVLYEKGILGVPALKIPIMFGVEKIREFEQRKELERQELFAKYQRGETLDWMEKQKIVSKIEELEAPEVTARDWRLTEVGLEAVEKVLGPLMEKVPEGAVVYPYKPISFLPFKVDIKKEMLTTPAPQWSVKLLDAIIKFQIFGVYMKTMATRKGKTKSKSKAKQKLVKVSKKFKEKVTEDLDDIIKTSKTRTDINRRLIEYMKDFRAEMRARGISEGIINENLKSIMEYSQARDFLLVKVYVPKTKVEKIATTKDISPLVDIPAEVPVEKIAPSVYAGLGLYERYKPSEEIFITPKPYFPSEVKLGENIFEGIAPTGKIESFLGTGKILGLGELGKFKTGVLTALTTISVQDLLTKQKGEQDLWYKTLQRGRLRERVGVGLGIGLISGLAFKQPQVMRQPQILKVRYKYKEPTKPRYPRKPTIPKIPIWMLKETEREKKLRRKRLLREGLFIPFVKRYGKFIPVGKPVTFRRARRRGIGALRRTLAATLEIRKARTGEPIPIAKVTRKFRPRKGKDIFGLVERAPFRLEALEERREIIAARKAGRIKFIK